MRLFPILAAILVSALIYVFLFERDRLFPADAPTGAEMAETGTVEAEAAPGQTPVGVVVLKSSARTVDSAVILRGQTEAIRHVDLRAETAGQVISEPLRKGTFVEQGDVMCRLDPGTRMASLAEAQARLAEAQSRVPAAEAAVPEAEARVEEAKARVEEAKAILEEAMINSNAATRLSQDGFASETRVASTQAAVRGAEAAITSAEAGLKSAASGLESVAAGIEAAKAGVESARAAVAAAEKEIERLTISAPFGGLLESDSAEIGSLLQPGDHCATVIQLDPILMVGYVPETEVGRVEVGAAALAEMASGEQVQGKVVFLSRSADPTTRTFRVDIEVANPDLALRDGQTAEIVIASDGKHAHLVPQSALTLDDEGTLGVRLVTEDSTAMFQPVTLLRDTPGGLWLAGLPDEADVIIIGQEYVIDGVRVAASYQTEDEEPAQ
ncbi:efflux RND transporter periplasmic adaptor subunit [Roseovarius faecimaris]|uniref:Efflux RND transporter periplasmic adaptor subunit n=1 Tax=Roseovarius faecimaris TaxID=2494550 RepID=A0A6I6INS4_9RHOB|nr:efflux RND transporter periplasmic adaptor subunit [Roseovarius faecimaris]QGX98770.1 efflux RND transporter periplasmic adaptor subunit [Roseovarius faecimaris]